MRFTLIATLLFAGQAAAQEPPLLRFVGPDSAMNVSVEQLVQVQSAQDGDRSILLVEMGDVAGERFAALTEQSEGESMTVHLCGRAFVTITSAGRIDGGKVIVPAPDLAFADTAAEVLRGETPCSDVLSF